MRGENGRGDKERRVSESREEKRVRERREKMSGGRELTRGRDRRAETYVKAKATRAPLTTIKSRMFHKSRK